jgi:hypothetical protein
VLAAALLRHAAEHEVASARNTPFEAGQFSLANTVAVAPAASSQVLLAAGTVWLWAREDASHTAMSRLEITLCLVAVTPTRRPTRSAWMIICAPV